MSNELTNDMFLSMIEFEICPATNKKVELFEAKNTSGSVNTKFVGEPNNDNCLVVSKLNTSTVDNFKFGVLGCKKGKCFLYEPESGRFAVDTGTCKFENFNLQYILSSDINKNSKNIEKFTSVTKLWNHLETLEEFK